MNARSEGKRIVAPIESDNARELCLSIRCDHEKVGRRCGHLECSRVEPEESGRCLSCSVGRQWR